MSDDDRTDSIRKMLTKNGEAYSTRPSIPDMELAKTYVATLTESLLQLCTAFGLSLTVEYTSENGYNADVGESDVPPNLADVASALCELDVAVTQAQVSCGLPQALMFAELVNARTQRISPDFDRILSAIMLGSTFVPTPPAADLIPEFKASPTDPLDQVMQGITPLQTDAVPATKELVGADPAKFPEQAEAHWRLSLTIVGEAIARFGTLLAQGPREDNAMMRGEIAARLEEAAYRIRHGRSPNRQGVAG